MIRQAIRDVVSVLLGRDDLGRSLVFKDHFGITADDLEKERDFLRLNPIRFARLKGSGR